MFDSAFVAFSSMNTEPRPVSAVMCTRNRPDLIAGAVASVLACDPPARELVVIDQSDSNSTEGALSALIAADPRLQYVHTDRVGLSSAYNEGIRRVTSELIAFTDDDCRAPVDWIVNVEAAFAEGGEQVQLLYGQVMGPEELQGAEGVLPRLEFEARTRIGPDTPFFVFGMGANFAARRALFERIGGFDEVLGGGGPLRSSQDFDFLYRVHQAGLTTLLEPTVKVDHYGIRTDGDWPATQFNYGVGDGAFYTKHARCGGRSSITLWLKKTARVAARSLGSQRAYARGYVYGMVKSLRYGIDRKRRIYVSR
jgi:glycosyltransferase involved in cell wall biosynthesis